MNSAAWLAANQRYLAASLHWLRLRLKQRLPPVSGAVAAAQVLMAAPTPRPTASSAVLSMAVPGLAQARSWFSQRASASGPGPAPAVALASPIQVAQVTPLASAPALRSLPPATHNADALRQAAAARDDAAQIEPPPALLTLAACFGLSPFERDVLLLCVAAELDSDIGALFAAAQGSTAHARPSFGLAFHVLDGPAWDALAPSRPMRGMRLVDLSQSAGAPLTASALRADERIVNYINGLNQLDARLGLLMVPGPTAVPEAVPVATTALLAASQQVHVDAILQLLRHAVADLVAATATATGATATAGDVTHDPLTPATGAAHGHGAGPTAHAQPSQPSEPNPRLAEPLPAPLLPPLHLASARNSLPALTIQLLGTDGASKLAVANAVCAGEARQLYQIGVDALPTTRAESENLARLWQREAALLPAALYVDAQALDHGSASAQALAALSWFLAHPLGLVFVSARDTTLAVASTAPSHVVAVRRPTAPEQCAAWRAALPTDWPVEAAADRACLLAGQFDLGLGDISSAARHRDAGPMTFDAVWDASRCLTCLRLDALAQRLDPRATWDDLVLCDESLDLLQQITSQLRHRYRVHEDWGYAKRGGRSLGMRRPGVSALFVGASGTGKTMAAEVIANALRLNLYRIDLSGVVSKYIGETEKNLRRLFDAAEPGGAILYFDAADAVDARFGTGSEIIPSSDGHGRDGSHVRHAHIAINQLLPQLESFSGLAILATHTERAPAPALLRRLRFVVNFPGPGRAERKAIWHKAWPIEVPCEGLDFDRLARVEVSGGDIRSVAMNAAFLAAERGTPVTMPLLMAALRTELRKLGKPVDEAGLR